MAEFRNGEAHASMLGASLQPPTMKNVIGAREPWRSFHVKHPDESARFT
jgi:hypothetical protein